MGIYKTASKYVLGYISNHTRTYRITWVDNCIYSYSYIYYSNRHIFTAYIQLIQQPQVEIRQAGISLGSLHIQQDSNNHPQPLLKGGEFLYHPAGEQGNGGRAAALPTTRGGAAARLPANLPQAFPQVDPQAIRPMDKPDEFTTINVRTGYWKLLEKPMENRLHEPKIQRSNNE